MPSPSLPIPDAVAIHPDQLTLGFDDLFEPEPPSRSGGPAHDLANLLSVIVAVSESLVEVLEHPKHAELARVGLLAAERAADLLNDLGGKPIARMGPRPPQRELPRRAETAPPLEAASVLVVDDDPRLLNLMSSAFTRAGFRTFSARNGRVALQILRAAKPDLLVTDIVMPEMEGLATIREAKQASPGTRVVAISGGGQYARHDRFLNWAEGLGADEVLAKPFKISSLLTAARLVLSREGEAEQAATQ